jgi:Neuraminidase (sialidase)
MVKKNAEPVCVRNVVCPTGQDNPRNGEGDVAVLKDGRLLLVYSHWTSPKSDDDAPAHIYGRYSTDGGLSWGSEFVMIPNDAMNLMSVSLLRLKNGQLMMAYGRRHSNAKMWFYARFSKDEGKTWSADTLITDVPAYQVLNNARVIQLKSGRLLVPVAICRGETWMKDYYFHGMVYYSDDSGKTWKTSGNKLDIKECKFGVDEPGVVELKDGRVMMVIRTDLGRIYRSYSSDRGITWTKPEAMELKSPVSPATVVRIPSTGHLLMVWNNTEPSKDNAGLPRSPLSTAISKDEGKTWENIRNLEDAPDGNYCYISVTFKGSKAILTYYERASLKVAVVDVDWFYTQR